MRAYRSPAAPVRKLRSPLTLQTLEGRITPAGLVTASLSPAGVLTIVGDDGDNGFRLRVSPTNVVIDADASTTINTEPVGGAATINGIVKSLKVDLKGGDDFVDIDPTVAFSVTGPISFTLGDGANTLEMITSEALTLGALTVKGGDGEDTVIVQGGAGMGSTATGAASFTYANGGSTTRLEEIAFSIGVKVTAGDAVGIPNNVDAVAINVAKVLTVDLGNSNPAIVNITDSGLGGLSAKGNQIGAILTTSTVLGNVSMKGVFQADLQTDGTVISKNVTLNAALASLTAFGAGTTINGNLGLTATSHTQTNIQTASLTEVKGNVTVKGGWFSDSFETGAQFKANKNVTLTLGGGDNIVTMGDPGGVSTITGNLKITTSAGVDAIALSRLALAGTASITTGAGNDLLSIEDGATFAKTFTSDLGSGDDTISFAQNLGAANAVSFTGTAKILAGAGNDLLLLGLTPGDPNSRAVFTAAVDTIDGGLGLDTFDAATSQFTGVTPTSWEL